jgi:hypothetical protein
MADEAMGNRMNKAQQRFILTEMLALARYLTSQSIPPPQVRQAVKRLRDDLIMLLRAGSKEITVDQQSYVPVTIDQEQA